jgi:uncharacterized protein YjbI with pentapeptide repeats
MDATILGALIGAGAGFLGVLLGLLVNTYVENRKDKSNRLRDMRTRLVGNRILAVEVMEFVKSQRKKKLIDFSSYLPKRFKKSFWLFDKDEIYNRPDLSGAKLSGIVLRRQDLSRVIFTNADLRYADLRESDLNNSIMRFTHLIGASLGGASLMKVDFSDANLEGIDAIETDFSSSDFIRANMQSVKMSHCTINSSIEKCDCKEADFSSSKIGGFIDTNLKNANFSYAEIAGSGFVKVNLSKANMSYIKSTVRTIFEDSILQGVDFTETNLEGVTFVNVDLTDAKVSREQLSKAYFGGKIIFPDWEEKYFPPAEKILKSGLKIIGYDKRIDYKPPE